MCGWQRQGTTQRLSVHEQYENRSAYQSCTNDNCESCPDQFAATNDSGETGADRSPGTNDTRESGADRSSGANLGVAR